jgi:transposase-like protein
LSSSVKSLRRFLAGDTLHGLAKRHDICRNLIRVWVQKYEVGAFDEDAAAADLLQQYEARREHAKSWGDYAASGRAWSSFED